MASSSFQDVLTDPTVPQVDLRTTGGTRQVAPTSTVGDIAAGAVALADIATKAIPVFEKIDKKNKLTEFNTGLAKILSLENQTGADQSTRVQNHFLTFSRNDPENMQLYASALQSAGVPNPIKQKADASMALENQAQAAGARAYPDAPRAVQIDQGWIILQNRRNLELAIKKAEIIAKEKPKEIKAINNAWEGVASQELEALGSTTLQVALSEAASLAKSHEDISSILSLQRGVKAMFTTLKAEFQQRARATGATTEDLTKAMELFKQAETTFTNIFSEDGEFGLKHFEMLKNKLSRDHEISMFKAAETTLTLKKILGPQLLAQLATKSALEGGFNEIAEEIASEIKLLFNKGDIDEDKHSRAQQTLGLLKSSEQIEKIAKNEDFRTDRFGRLTSQLQQQISEAGPKDEKGLMAYFNVASNTAILGTKYATLPSNIRLLNDTFNTNGHKMMMKELDQKRPAEAKALRSRTVEMAHKALVSNLKEMKGDLFNYHRDAVTYRDGRFEFDEEFFISRAKRQPLSGMGAQQSLTQIREMVNSANAALAIHVDNKQAIDRYSKLSDKEMRDTAVYFAQGMSGTTYTKENLKPAASSFDTEVVNLTPVEDRLNRKVQDIVEDSKSMIAEGTARLRRRIDLRRNIKVDQASGLP